MTKLLITGASGFVGSYFIKHYKEKYDIQAFSFQKDDFETLHVKGVDIVLHLSALVHQMNGASEDEYEKINVTQTLALAKKAKASGVKQFVFMSTVKVYGEESEIPYTETSTCKPQDAYGKTKLKAEKKLQKLQDEHFKINIIRTPIVYGAGVKANIQSLTRLIQKVPVLPFGSIQNKRSFVYVGNLCHLVDEVIRFQTMLGMTGENSHPESPTCRSEQDLESQNIFLASDNEPLSTTMLCKLIAKNLNKKLYLFKIPLFETLLRLLKPSFHKRLYGSLEVDNTQTRKKLNLKNPYSTENDIRLMLKGKKI